MKTYKVVKGCDWKDPKTGTPHNWKPGDTLKDGDVPAPVVAVLLRQKAIVPEGE